MVNLSVLYPPMPGRFPGVSVASQVVLDHLQEYEKLLDADCVEYYYLSDTPCLPGFERYNYLFRIIFFPDGIHNMIASYDGVVEKRRLPAGSVAVGGKRNWSFSEPADRNQRSFSVVFMRDLTRLVFSQPGDNGKWQTLYCHFPPPTGIQSALLECADQVIADRMNDRHKRINALLKAILAQFRCDLTANGNDLYHLPENVARAVHYVEMNYASKINCSSVAEALQLNRTMLSGDFHRSMGETMQKYITRLRLQKACWLLKSSPLKIKRIAEFCGFETAGCFIKVFRKKYNQTPRQWRNRISLKQ
ncbi:MAG: helix-turn-helix transcriptional regulator [Lentisphaerae bacterium]|nr:helix-turn-helix transcriptional regulator [Lentisphaerota bacterium]